MQALSLWSCLHCNSQSSFLNDDMSFLCRVTGCDRVIPNNSETCRMWIIAQHTTVSFLAYTSSELNSLIVGGVRKWCSFSSCFIQLRLDWSGLWPWGVSGKGGVMADGWGAEGKSASHYLPPPPGRCVSSSSPLSHRVTTLRGGSQAADGHIIICLHSELKEKEPGTTEDVSHPVRMLRSFWWKVLN